MRQLRDNQEHSREMLYLLKYLIEKFVWKWRIWR